MSLEVNSAKFRIRRADRRDLEWIAKFQVSMALETEELELDPDVVLQGAKYIFENPDTGFYVNAKLEDKPMGCLLVLKEWSDWRNAFVWWIHSVYISPEYRKKGVFSRMFEYIEKLAHESGAKGLRLYVDKDNFSAKKVYSKLNMNCEHYELFEKMF